MTRKYVTLFVLSILTFVGTSHADKDLTSYIDLPFTKVVLSNGLTVIVHEDHKAPIVAVNVWYHVGSKNEPSGKNGFAHLFEHLMFQGSENFDDDYFQVMEKVGATDLNGTTNEDRTNYFQNVPSTAFETALFMESDRMGHFVNAISQAKLDEQRKVVLNEKRQGLNRPYWGIAEELIAKGAFPAGHPYSWTTIGSEKDLNAASLADVKEWFQTYYGPNNAVLTVVGDIKTAEAIEKVKKYFGDIPPGPRIARMKEWIGKRTETKREVAQDDVPFAKLLKIWNIPGIASLDYEKMDVVSDILSASKSSPLYKEIVYNKQLATDISASIYPSEIASLFVIDATAKEGVTLAQLEAAINETIEKFLKNGPSSDELNRDKTQYKTHYIGALEKIGGFSGQANLLASNEIFTGDAGTFKSRFRERMNFTKDDIRDAARTWISNGDFNLEIVPFPKFQPLTSSINRKSVPYPTNYPEAHFPKVEETTLSNGIRLLVAQRKHIPEVEMGVVMNTGFVKDPKDKLGTARMAFDLLDEGTKKHTLFQLSDMLDHLGSSINAFSGIEQSGLFVKSLVPNLDPTLKILAEMILTPAFPQKEFDRIRKETLEEIQQEKIDPSSIASRVFNQLAFGKDHPYGIPLSGTGYEKTIKALQREDAVQFYNTWAKPNNTTIIAVGDITLADMKEKLEKTLGDWKKSDLPKFSIPVVAQEKEAKKIYVVDKPHSPQTAIYVGHFFPTFKDPKEVSNKLVNEILGGSFTSRINMNLRENKGWSYGAHSGVMDFENQGLWMVRTPVQIDKTDVALKEIQNEIDSIQTQKRPITSAEFNQQKENTILALAGKWEINAAIYDSIRKLVFYHMDPNFFLTYPQKLQQANLSDVIASARSIIHPDHLVWLLVGDQEKVIPMLQKQGLNPILIDADGNPVK